MQQTQTYKLNKPGVDDPIAIAPLNENAEKIEAALTRLSGTDADLQSRVTVLEARHFVVGSYVGTGGKAQEVILGFTPKGVLVQGNCDNQIVILALNDEPGRNHYGVAIEIIPNGFRATMNAVTNQTQKNKTFYFVAFD